MNEIVIKCLRAVTFSLLFIFLCLLVMPLLIKGINQSWGKWLYVTNVVITVFLAIRLRYLVRKLG